jgi:ABC-type uncharacterized transport system permease subunit
MEQQSRWRSKVVWASMLALIYFVLKEWVGFEKRETIKTILFSWNHILVFCGIYKAPRNVSNKSGHAFSISFRLHAAIPTRDFRTRCT